MLTEPKSDPVSGRGRIIVATTFVTLVVIYGAWYSYSVFLVALLREFHWSRSLVAGAFAVFVLVHGLLGPVVGELLRRFGPRRLIMVGGCVMGLGLFLTAETRQWWQLYIAFSGITATGISLTGWIPLVVLVRGWFPRRVGTMMGLASAGIGVGIFGLVPLAQFLIDTVGWRWAYRVFGLLVSAWILPAAVAFVRDPPPTEDDAAGLGAGGPAMPKAASYWTLATAATSWRFWGLAVVYFTGNFVTQMLMIHQVAYLVDHGVLAITAATVGGAVGLVSIGAKIGWGALSDRAGRELAYGLALGCVMASIWVLVIAGTRQTLPWLYLYAMLIGLGYGVMAPVPPAIASDLFGGPGFSTIFGTLYLVLCLGLAAGTWSAGELYDLTGTYAVALWVGLAMAVISPALLWVVAPRRPNPPPDLPRPARPSPRQSRAV